MDLETIKNSYSMQEILDRLNIPVNRSGFCKCVFHAEDTASMKVYKTGYYCFGCGRGGDNITFVRDYLGLNFKDACEWISGEELTKQTKAAISARTLRRNRKKEKEKQLKETLAEVNKDLPGLWQTYLHAEPLSEEAANAYNKWQILVYRQEIILNELGAI